MQGKVYGYALNMGDGALIYVQPLSVVLLIKHDPGELFTWIGMATVILGSILMCLVKGRKNSPAGDFDSPESTPLSSKNSPASSQNSPATTKKSTTKPINAKTQSILT